MTIHWQIEDSGQLVVTLDDPEERAILLCELYPGDNAPEQIAGFPADLISRYQEIKAADYVRPNLSWNVIEREVYEPITCNSEIEFYPTGEQDIFALWSGPLFVEAVERDADDRPVEVHGRVWSDDFYAYYRSPAGIDTLALTGKAVWEPVPLERYDDA